MIHTNENKPKNGNGEQELNCPQCDRPSVKNGTNRSGSQQYYCRHCKKSFTDSNLTQGRPAIGDRPMTASERKRRSRGKKNEQN